jgi:hypothetical protein
MLDAIFFEHKLQSIFIGVYSAISASIATRSKCHENNMHICYAQNCGLKPGVCRYAHICIANMCPNFLRRLENLVFGRCS